MVINWTKTAKKDLRGFHKHSKRHSENSVKKYIESLVEYVEILDSYPNLGKVLFRTKSVEVRQLIFKKHKILYYYEFNQIIILSIIHSSRDFSKVIKKLNKKFSLK